MLAFVFLSRRARWGLNAIIVGSHLLVTRSPYTQMELPEVGAPVSVPCWYHHNRQVRNRWSANLWS